MTLPAELSTLFANKQKSFKMVLVLALIDEMKVSNQREVSFNEVKKRFLGYFQQRAANGAPIDQPPDRIASRWEEVTLNQVQPIIDTPIKALSALIEKNAEQQTIGFQEKWYRQWDDSVWNELYDYAVEEIQNYYSQRMSGFSLHDALKTVMSDYLQAKTESFAGHKLGAFVRQTIPHELSQFSFIHDNLKVQGSVGQGNWATIPWIAIMDKRITLTTQQGEYIVYLFAEDMKSVYLTFNQGVTIPLRDKGRRVGHQYLQHQVNVLRELLPLDGMRKDDQIYLTSGGLGQDYQVSTVAYYRYDIDHLPNDENLISDLQNVVNNYKLYVESIEPEEDSELGSYNYMIAHLYLTQGITNFLGSVYPIGATIEQLIDNQNKVLFSGDDVKRPRVRIQHIGRALSELGLVELNNKTYILTEQGYEFYLHRGQNFWQLGEQQITLLRDHITNHDHSSLLKAIRSAIQIVQELRQFDLTNFSERFVAALGKQDSWGEVTQNSRSRFILNWLQELMYITKEGNQYTAMDIEEQAPVDTLAVTERLKIIKAFIKQKGFQYPDHMVENFYLSLKSKPFVILAGISGTGKTKLVKLFAEAIGATEANKQFTLIPVRPDWSDPTDLIGYQDLSGVFRLGELTKVLLEASKRENRHKPYFICLDEMNLARVEHYFSDVLSLLETQQWKDGRIVTDTIVPKEMLNASGNEERKADLYIPDNVFIVGTVNMDETTHPFSKKVLDRANTIEFNYINLQDFPEMETDEGTIEHGTASSPFLRSDYLQLKDAYAEHSELIKKTTEKLVPINQMLEEIHAHVGFRVRDAVCFYMIYNQRFELMTEEQAFDLQLLQKVLPRIQGSSQSVKRLLIELMLFCTNQKGKMEELLNDAAELYDPWRRSAEEPKALYPQSARKLAYMLRRLEEDGFTSFWLS